MKYEETGFCRSIADPAAALKTANIFYALVLGVVALIGFVLYNTSGFILNRIINTKYTEEYGLGIAAVARTTAPLALWFVIHAFAGIGNSNLEESCQFQFHVKGLPFHVLAFLGLWVAFWFMPDEFCDVYMQAAPYISGVYLFVQILFLLDFLNELNDRWTADENLTIPFVITAVMGVGALVAYGVSFYVFMPDGCSNNGIFIGIHLSLSVILFVIAAVVAHGSILTAALFSAYTAYLTVSGLMCVPGCSRIARGSQGITFSVVASVFTLIWAARSAFSSRNRLKSFILSEEVEGQLLFSIAFFHALLAFASVYVTMIVTHWGAVGDEDVSWATSRGSVSRWVNFAAAWATFLLYGWSLLAPVVCTSREFSA
jgi:hypothetical protein